MHDEWAACKKRARIVLYIDFLLMQKQRREKYPMLHPILRYNSSLLTTNFLLGLNTKHYLRKGPPRSQINLKKKQIAFNNLQCFLVVLKMYCFLKFEAELIEWDSVLMRLRLRYYVACRSAKRICDDKCQSKQKLFLN